MRKRIVAAAAVGVVVALLAVFPAATTAQDMPVVGVAAIEVAAQNISCDAWQPNCTQALAEGFRVMLETAITRTGRMSVMERTRLDAVLGEQILGEAGLTDSGGRVGGLTGVDYVIYGTVTKFGASESGFSVGRGLSSVTSRFGFGRRSSDVSSDRVTTEMAVDLRVTEVANGQILVADTVEGTAQQGRAISAPGFSMADASGDPWADVQRLVAAKITESVVTARNPVRIVTVQRDGTIILNYGAVFFSPGDQLVAFEVGEGFTDPDTGIVLGAEEIELGRIEVTRVEAQFSRAMFVGRPFEMRGESIIRRARTNEGDDQRRRSGGRWR